MHLERAPHFPSKMRLGAHTPVKLTHTHSAASQKASCGPQLHPGVRARTHHRLRWGCPIGQALGWLDSQGHEAEAREGGPPRTQSTKTDALGG